MAGLAMLYLSKYTHCYDGFPFSWASVGSSGGRSWKKPLMSGVWASRGGSSSNATTAFTFPGGFLHASYGIKRVLAFIVTTFWGIRCSLC